MAAVVMLLLMTAGLLWFYGLGRQTQRDQDHDNVCRWQPTPVPATGFYCK